MISTKDLPRLRELGEAASARGDFTEVARLILVIALGELLTLREPELRHSMRLQVVDSLEIKLVEALRALGTFSERCEELIDIFLRDVNDSQK